MDKKKISIVCPVYNCENYIIRMISSVFSQTFDDYELILVNDGSTDNSLQIIKDKLGELNDSRFRVISQGNKGAPAARNLGISLSNGEFIYLCDADDRLDENCLKNLTKMVIDDSVDIVIGNFISVNPTTDELLIQNERIKKRFYKLKETKYYVIDPMPGNKLFRRDRIELYDIKFADVKIGQDFNFYMKYCIVARKIVLCDEVVYYYSIIQNSISRTFTAKILDIVASSEDILDFYDHHTKTASELQLIKLQIRSNFINQYKKIHYFEDSISAKEASKRLKYAIRNLKCDHFKYRNMFYADDVKYLLYKLKNRINTKGS